VRDLQETNEIPKAASKSRVTDRHLFRETANLVRKLQEEHRTYASARSHLKRGDLHLDDTAMADRQGWPGRSADRGHRPQRSRVYAPARTGVKTGVTSVATNSGLTDAPGGKLADEFLE
jgi:hypothetical protein